MDNLLDKYTKALAQRRAVAQGVGDKLYHSERVAELRAELQRRLEEQAKTLEILQDIYLSRYLSPQLRDRVQLHLIDCMGARNFQDWRSASR